MKKCNCIVFIFTLWLVAICPVNGFSWPVRPVGVVEENDIFSRDLPEPQTNEATTVLVDPNSGARKISEAGTPETVESSAGVGFTLAAHDGDILLAVPLSYTFYENYKVELAPSLIHREPQEGGFGNGAHGVGDTEFGFKIKYRVSVRDDQFAISGISLKAPTGDPMAESADGVERLPLGTGAWDLTLNQAFLVFFDKFDMTFFVWFAYRFNGLYSYTSEGVKYTERYGNVFYYYFQSDIRVSDREWFIYSALGGKFVREGKVTIDGYEIGMNDRLALGEISAGAKYFAYNDIAVQAGLTYPLLVSQDEDTYEPYPRSFSPLISLQSWF